MEGNLDEAQSVADRLSNSLNIMGYTGMPIYADVLSVFTMESIHGKGEV